LGRRGVKMSDKFVQLPNDSGNTGKKVRTNERSVGADAVMEHFNIVQDRLSDVQASVLTSDPSGSEGGIIVRNIPSGVHEVTGSLVLSAPVAVSNFPDVQQVTGSIFVLNMPTTQRVTGSIGLAEPVAVSNFPSVQSVTGSVELTEPVAVSNFPVVQEIVGTVDVSNFPSVQEIIGTVAVSNFPSVQSVTGSVELTEPITVSNFPAVQAVTGSVYISAPVAVSNFPTVQPVTGSIFVLNFPTTQTVTGSVELTEPVAVSNFPVVQSVTGSVLILNLPSIQQITGSVKLTEPIAVSNFPATQPVTGSIFVLNFPSFPVTQVVSGSNWIPTVTGSVGISAPVAVSNFPAVQSVTGSVELTEPAMVASGSVIGLLVGGVSLSSANPVPVIEPILTKGTQGTTGLSTQDLKDAGRQHVLLAWEEMAGTAAAESALTNFTFGTRNATALAAANNYTVSSGKTLRIQSIIIYVKATSNINNLARVRIRQAASGITNASPVIFDTVISLGAPGTVAANLLARDSCALPDGIEVAAGQQITFTWFTSANSCTVGMTILGYEY
jgi:hypothetical protein